MGVHDRRSQQQARGFGRSSGSSNRSSSRSNARGASGKNDNNGHSSGRSSRESTKNSRESTKNSIGKTASRREAAASSFGSLTKKTTLADANRNNSNGSFGSQQKSGGDSRSRSAVTDTKTATADRRDAQPITGVGVHTGTAPSASVNLTGKSSASTQVPDKAAMKRGAEVAAKVSSFKTFTKSLPLGMDTPAGAIVDFVSTRGMSKDEKKGYEKVNKTESGLLKAGVSLLKTGAAAMNPLAGVAINIGNGVYNHYKRLNNAEQLGVDTAQYRRTQAADAFHVASNDNQQNSQNSSIIVPTPLSQAAPALAVPDYSQFDYGSHLNQFTG